MAPGRRAQGRADRDRGARTGAVAVAPFENPALASGGTGDVLSGTIGSLLAQRLAPYDAARLGVYLHGLAGERVRERLGDAGLLASDLPDPIAMARKRLAAIAERERTGRRLGFGRATALASTAAARPAGPAGTPEAPSPDDPEAAPTIHVDAREPGSGS